MKNNIKEEESKGSMPGLGLVWRPKIEKLESPGRPPRHRWTAPASNSFHGAWRRNSAWLRSRGCRLFPYKNIWTVSWEGPLDQRPPAFLSAPPQSRAEYMKAQAAAYKKEQSKFLAKINQTQPPPSPVGQDLRISPSPRAGLLDFQHSHADEILSILEARGGALDLSDTGTGKTFSSLAAAAHLLGAGRITGVIVVCPLSVIPSWRDAAAHFGITNAEIYNYESLRAGNKKRVRKKIIPGRKKDGTIKSVPFFQWVLGAQNKYLVIFDEAHRLKNPDSQTSQMAAAAIKEKGSHYFLCLSATLASDLEHFEVPALLAGFYPPGGWGIFSEPFLGRLPGTHTSPWWFDPRVHGVRLLGEWLASHRGAHRMRKTEIEGWPQVKIQTTPLQLSRGDTKKVAQAYAELAELESQIETREEQAERAIWLTKRLRARQAIELAKIAVIIDRVKSAVEEGLSAAVFLNFTETRTALAKAFPQAAQIHGGQTQEEREEQRLLFQKDKTSVILLNTAAGGVGLSLHDITGVRPRMAVISPSDSAVQIRQALGRVDRAGAKSTAVQHLIFAAGTVEEKIQENLKRKLKRIDQLNDADLGGPGEG